MSNNYMHQLIVTDKINKIVAPLALIYMFWLLMTVMFDFKVFMISLLVQFVLIGGFALIELVLAHPRTKS